MASVCGSALALRVGIWRSRWCARDDGVDGVGGIPIRVVCCRSVRGRTVAVAGRCDVVLRPDRIDRMDTGGRLIIDYKSRAPARTHWLGEKPQEPQLPLYTLLDNDIEGIAFGEFSVTGPVRFVSLGERYAIASRDAQSLSSQTGGLVDDWPDLVRYWRRILDRLATDFANGRADIDPTPTACSYCSLSSVCRLHHVQFAHDPDEESVPW